MMLLGQQRAQYVINEVKPYDKVQLRLNAPGSSFNIRPGHLDKPILIYGDRVETMPLEPIMSSELREGILMTNFEIKGNQKKAERVIAGKMMGNNSRANNPNWNIYLSNTKPYDLDLKYGVGSAYLDLAGLAIEKLSIYTASADVKVGYTSNQPNLVAMDSFMVKVDLGSVEIHKLNMARASNIRADVGFGSLMLDFSDRSQQACNINASVGAGKLEVIMPVSQTPIKIRLHASPLCTVKLPDNFKKIDKYHYINEFFVDGAEDALNFDLDVAMGSIIFRNK